MIMRCYSELIRLETFDERFEYLKLQGTVGQDTFGFDRYLNQLFYQHSKEWRAIRDKIIARDNGCDLGVPGYEIRGVILIHHMNPISKDDILNHNIEALLDPRFLISTSPRTHRAVHYGTNDLPVQEPIVRSPNDTCPWKRWV